MFRRRQFGVVVAVAGLLAVPQAHADPGDGIAINGTYTAFSDGVWARTDDSYHDERSVTQTWTVTSSCSTYQDCTGRVTSDQGWSADLVYISGRWKVTRPVDNWQPCNDGTVLTGQQSFTFWNGYPDPVPLKGWDTTLGPSGGCGKNKQLNIEMPFTLTPVA
ncbi:MAG: Rv2253/PknI dimerization domain-containing protein [Ilumatobacteraceae bacterium]